MQRIDFFEILKRSETNPIMLSDKFNLKVIPNATKEVLDEIQIEYDPNILVSTDNSLADDVWNAGYKLFLKTGLYSVNSRRPVLITEEEVEDQIKYYSPNIQVGEGKDKRQCYHRKINDTQPPMLFGGPFNADVSEEMIVKLNEAFAREKIIDVLFMPGHIRKMDGMEIRVNSGAEVKAVLKYARAAREAINRAGRPGMAISALATMGHNEIAASNEAWGLRKCDPRCVLFIAEMGVEDLGFARLAHFHDYGNPIQINFTPLIGGYAGGPAGTAVLAVACHLAGLVLGGDIFHFGPQHIKYGQQTNKHSLWVASVANAAIARNTNFMSITSHTCTGRPGLLQYWYEIAALALTAVVNGAHVSGPRPAMPVRLNHVSPLTARWLGEVAHAATKMTPQQVSSLVLELYKKYQDSLEFDKVTLGNTFEELYDIETLRPLQEHYDQYTRVRAELESMGVSFSV